MPRRPRSLIKLNPEDAALKNLRDGLDDLTHDLIRYGKFENLLTELRAGSRILVLRSTRRATINDLLMRPLRRIARAKEPTSSISEKAVQLLSQLHQLLAGQ
jgi:hypothetical protein